MDTKKEGASIFMSKQLTPKQWKNCFKKYKSYSQSQFWNYYAKFKINKTITQRQKQWLKNTYISYKKGIYSMSRKKAMTSPKRKKTIDWDIFTREDLIKIAERYKEITEDKKKKGKMKETKNLDLQVLSLSFYLVFPNQGITTIEKLYTNL